MGFVAHIDLWCSATKALCPEFFDAEHGVDVVTDLQRGGAVANFEPGSVGGDIVQRGSTPLVPPGANPARTNMG
jgi:hypothetical protein